MSDSTGPENPALPAASPENLRRRAEMLRGVRRFFDQRGFLEVQTPVLSADTLVDRFVEPLTVRDDSLPTTYRGDKTYYLQTSPEFAMKRLLAAGMERIYQIGPVFRKGDRGRLHNIEFTMLEWYRVGESYREAMQFLAELVRSVGEAFFSPDFLVPEIALRSYAEVFQETFALDPHRTSADRLRSTADEAGISYPDSYRTESAGDPMIWLDLLFAERVQPRLDAVLVYDYPGMQSQLARCRTVSDSDGEYSVAERFELFLGGLEIANGYHELLDADELRRRFEETGRRRAADGREPLPVESRLLAAMESGLPPCCGAALGIDRLLTFFLGGETIDEVLAFPIERA